MIESMNIERLLSVRPPARRRAPVALALLACVLVCGDTGGNPAASR